MPPTPRTRGLACLLAFTATTLVSFGQDLLPEPTLPPNPLALTPPPTPPPGAALTGSSPVTGTGVTTAGEILVSDPGGCCEPPREKWELLPTSLLWEPKLADKRDPRLSLVRSDVNSYFSNSTMDPSIGLTAGIVRLRPESFPWIQWQMDVFAVAHLRFSRGDESIAQDYRYGVPFTFRAGNWQGKIGYEHTSTQLGDEFNAFLGRQRIKFERDEAVVALGYLWDNQLRTYGQIGYGVYRSIPGEPERWRYDVGFDWFKRETTGRKGQPFAAINAAFNGEVNYAATMNYQVGWMWRKEGQRLGQFRVYAEFFDGHSVFGQLFRDRERYAGLGIALDY